MTPDPTRSANNVTHYRHPMTITEPAACGIHPALSTPDPCLTDCPPCLVALNAALTTERDALLRAAHTNVSGAIPAGPVTAKTEMVFVAGIAFVSAVKHEEAVGRIAEERDALKAANVDLSTALAADDTKAAAIRVAERYKAERDVAIRERDMAVHGRDGLARCIRDCCDSAGLPVSPGGPQGEVVYLLDRGDVAKRDIATLLEAIEAHRDGVKGTRAALFDTAKKIRERSANA